jgi:hypothetical protein
MPRGDPVETGGNGAAAIVAHGNSLYVADFTIGAPGSVSTIRLGWGLPFLQAEPPARQADQRPTSAASS